MLAFTTGALSRHLWFGVGNWVSLLSLTPDYQAEAWDNCTAIGKDPHSGIHATV